jgi:uncharacterized protein (DUF2336 family)
VLRWESRDETFFNEIGLQNANKNNLIDTIARANSLSELVTTSNISSAFKFVDQCADDLRDAFIHTRYKAKLTGKMLAHFLASRENKLFNAKSISLIGYSLGTQVIKSCVNRLSKLDKTDLI